MGIYFRRKKASTSNAMAVIQEPITRVPTLVHFLFVQKS